MSTPQQNFILGTQIRPAAKRMASLYFFCESLQAEANAANWLTVFPNDNAVVDDGAVSDGRPVVTDAQIRAFISIAGTFITYMEATSNANLNATLALAVNPEQV